MEPGKTLLLDANVMAAAITNIAQAIISEFPEEHLPEIALVGIQLRGVPFASRLAEQIAAKTGRRPLCGSIDINMYRDDIGMRKMLPVIRETSLPFDVNGRILILADDVLQTGRTIRAALDALNSYGRPSLIRLAALLDRGLREYPIRADYTGKLCELPREKRIKVYWQELDGEDTVYTLDRTQKT
ncbi:MAG: hypothetical protein A2X49_14000 [Lentisphaerae bacterium GWF2_52_8]|nr:MAG: hypothetical protein A2X49_14000 [Lentisphaerae bacterium GWF2_52_8]